MQKELQSADDINPKESKYILHIPQGFYGVITPESDESIKGMFMDGLGPCACLIVISSDRRYIFLAHLDGKGMNIGDKELGIVSWIEKIKKYNGKIYIHCGKGFQEGVKEETNYETEIKEILLANELRCLVENIQIHEVKNESAGLVLREGTNINIYGEPIVYDPNSEPLSGMIVVLEELGFKIINFSGHHMWRNDYMEYQKDELEEVIESKEAIGACAKLRYDITKKTTLPFDSTDQDNTLPFPPICCYEGIGPFLNEEREKVTYRILNNKYQKIIDEYKNTIEKLFNNGATTYKK